MTLDFQPVVHLVAISGDRLLVAYDSNNDDDETRSVASYPTSMVAGRLIALEPAITDYVTDGANSKVTFTVALNTSEEKTFPLGVTTLAVKPLSGKVKDPKFPTKEQLLVEIRQGLAQAMSDGLENLASAQATSGYGGPVLQGPKSGVIGSARAVRHVAAARSTRVLPYAFGGALAVAVAIFLMVVVKVMRPPEDPYKAALSAAIQQRTADARTSANAQVELTRDTLKSMGFDPGKTTQTGCLAPK